MDYFDVIIRKITFWYKNFASDYITLVKAFFVSVALAFRLVKHRALLRSNRITKLVITNRALFKFLAVEHQEVLSFV